MIDPRSVPVRYSNLRQMALSPAHYLDAVQRNRQETLSMRLGTGGHALLFEPDKVAVFDGVRSGKKWEAFQAERPGVVILNPREHALANGMANALRGHEEAARLLLDGAELERQISWSIDGRACQGRPDSFAPNRVVDLKTCKTANPDQFTRKATWMNYHAQVFWYRDGLVSAGLANPVDCYLVVVESTPPFCVTVLRLTERALEMGQRSVRAWWERLMSCETSNEWPGYVQSTVEFDVPDDDGVELTFAGGDSLYEAGQEG